MLKLIKDSITNYWRPVLAYASAVSILIWLLLFKLGSLTPSLSPYEKSSLHLSQSLNVIWDNLIFAPYRLLVLLAVQIDSGSIFGLRVVSVIMAILCVALFYYLVKSWYKLGTVLLSMTLFVSSAWFLHLSRQATPDIMLPLSILILLAYGTWTLKTNRNNLALFVGALIVSLLLYTPGIILLLVVGCIWQRKSLSTLVKQTSLFTKIFSLALIAVAVTPALLLFIRNPEAIKVFAGLSADNSFSFTEFVINLLKVPIWLFVQGPLNWANWLGRQPLIGIFTAIMGAVGFYSYYLSRKLEVVKTLIGIIAVGSVLVSLGGLVNIAILFPVVLLAASRGLSFMLSKWFNVFPRNPVAKKIGFGIITIIVVLSGIYNLNSYFTAWPNAPETKATFSKITR